MLISSVGKESQESPYTCRKPPTEKSEVKTKQICGTKKLRVNRNNAMINKRKSGRKKKRRRKKTTIKNFRKIKKDSRNKTFNIGIGK